MRKKVMLIDDSEPMKDIIQKLLKNKGYQFICAENGKDAFNKIEFGTKLIILDIEMPQMNGFEFLETFNKRNLKIPIIVLSTESSKDKIMKGKELGIRAWVIKPFKLPELEKLIEEIISH